MLIPIPVGTKHVAAARARVWRFVACEDCRQDFAYPLDLEGAGQDYDLLFTDAETSAARAQAQAEQNLMHKSRNVVLPIPCPHCGFYQADMSRQLKDVASINLQQVVGLMILLLSFAALALDVPYSWVLTVVVAIGGLAVLTRGCLLALRFDPNGGDRGRRKTVGQSQTVWGEQLAELRAAVSPSEPDGPAKAPPVGPAR